MTFFFDREVCIFFQQEFERKIKQEKKEEEQIVIAVVARDFIFCQTVLVI